MFFELMFETEGDMRYKEACTSTCYNAMCFISAYLSEYLNGICNWNCVIKNVSIWLAIFLCMARITYASLYRVLTRITLEVCIIEIINRNNTLRRKILTIRLNWMNLEIVINLCCVFQVMWRIWLQLAY